MNYQSPFPIHLENDTIMEHGHQADSCLDCPDALTNIDQLAEYVEQCFEATETTQDPSHALLALELLTLTSDPASQATPALARALVKLISKRADGHDDIYKSLSHIWNSKDNILIAELEYQLATRAASMSLGQIASDQLITNYVQVGRDLYNQSAVTIVARLNVAKNH